MKNWSFSSSILLTCRSVWQRTFSEIVYLDQCSWGPPSPRVSEPAGRGASPCSPWAAPPPWPRCSAADLQFEILQPISRLLGSPPGFYILTWARLNRSPTYHHHPPTPPHLPLTTVSPTYPSPLCPPPPTPPHRPPLPSSVKLANPASAFSSTRKNPRNPYFYKTNSRVLYVFTYNACSDI